MIHSVPSDIYDCPTCRQPLLYAVNEDGEGLDHEMVCSTCCRAYLVDMQTGALESMADALKVARGRADALQKRLDALLAPAEGVDLEKVLRRSEWFKPGVIDWDDLSTAEWAAAIDQIADAPALAHEVARLRAALVNAEQRRDAAHGIAPEDGRRHTLLLHLTPHLLKRVQALGYVPGETPAGVLPWLVGEMEEARLTLAAEQGRAEGAPSSDWRRKNGVWERDYPNGDSATVFPDGTWFRGRFGGPPARKGQAENQRDAMLAADKATP